MDMEPTCTLCPPGRSCPLATNMDHTLDLALIQSEALYCLRKDQLISLCKRYGIKPKGKVRILLLT